MNLHDATPSFHTRLLKIMLREHINWRFRIEGDRVMQLYTGTNRYIPKDWHDSERSAEWWAKAYRDQME